MNRSRSLVCCSCGLVMLASSIRQMPNMRNWSPPGRPTVRPVGFIQPCIPTGSKVIPSGPQWIDEIKHDGYGLILRKADKRVRIFTRRGYDWTDKYPIIGEAMRKLCVTSATIDGEGVYCGPDGLADFENFTLEGASETL